MKKTDVIMRELNDQEIHEESHSHTSDGKEVEHSHFPLYQMDIGKAQKFYLNI